MKWVTAILCILLFPFGYWICLWAYPNDVVQFFDLRYNLYAGLIFLAFTTLYLWITDIRARVIFNIGIGLSVSDIADRLLFDCTKWQSDDWVMIGLTILYSWHQWSKNS